jgi:hypothetical protein
MVMNVLILPGKNMKTFFVVNIAEPEPKPLGPELEPE